MGIWVQYHSNRQRMFLDVILDPQFPLELVGHLELGNLHLSPHSPGSGSTSEEGAPRKGLHWCTLLYPGEKSGFAVQGQWCFFFTDNAFIPCPFWEIKDFSGIRVLRRRVWKFLLSRKNDTEERFIFRRFISTNTFEKLPKSHVFTSKRYYFLYFRESRLIARSFQSNAKRP